MSVDNPIDSGGSRIERRRRLCYVPGEVNMVNKGRSRIMPTWNSRRAQIVWSFKEAGLAQLRVSGTSKKTGATMEALVPNDAAIARFKLAMDDIADQLTQWDRSGVRPAIYPGNEALKA